MELAADCAVGAVCGSTRYEWAEAGGSEPHACAGELTLVSADNAPIGYAQDAKNFNILNMAERIVSGDCAVRRGPWRRAVRTDPPCHVSAH